MIHRLVYNCTVDFLHLLYEPKPLQEYIHDMYFDMMMMRSELGFFSALLYHPVHHVFN